MEKILFLTHTEADGSLSRGAREALAAALSVTGSLPASTLTVGLWGEQVGAAADAIAGCGAVAFHGVTGQEFTVPRYSSDAAAATES